MSMLLIQLSIFTFLSHWSSLGLFQVSRFKMYIYRCDLIIQVYAEQERIRLMIIRNNLEERNTSDRDVVYILKVPLKH